MAASSPNLKRFLASPAGRRAAATGWAGAIALAIGAPWFAKGYWFGTDWPAPRFYRFPPPLASVAPLRGVLGLASKVLAAELTGKLLVVGVLFVAALTVYHALPVGGFVPRASAAAIYILNPIVYSRLLYGQLFILAAYAVLPWVLHRLRLVVADPSLRHSAWLAVSLACLGATDIHLLFPAAVLCVATGGFALLGARRDLGAVLALVRAYVATGAVAVVLTAYWTVPFILHASGEARLTARFTNSDLFVFQTAPDPRLGPWGNVLGLYGFFGEASGYFRPLKAFAPLWPLGALVIIGLSGVALVALLVTRRLVFPGSRPWAAGLSIGAVVSVVMGVGVADRHIGPVILALHGLVPALRGMREAQKWVVLLALVYSQLFPLGLLVLGDAVRRRVDRGRHLLVAGAVGVIGLGLPLYYGNGLVDGARGQIRVSSYPASWYRVDSVMAARPNRGRMLFLPWVLYGNWSFINDRNPVVASPANIFFSIPVVSSKDLRINGVPPPIEPEQVAIRRLLNREDQGPWGFELTRLNIEWVVLAREGNWHHYHYLDNIAALQLVEDDDSLVLYRNAMWHP